MSELQKQNPQAVALYGKMLAFSRLKINSNDITVITEQLARLRPDKVVPVIVETAEHLDLTALRELLWQNNMAIMGVVDGVLSEQAEQLKLATFPADGKRIARLDDSKLKADADGSNTQPDTQTEQKVATQTHKSEIIKNDKEAVKQTIQEKQTTQEKEAIKEVVQDTTKDATQDTTQSIAQDDAQASEQLNNNAKDNQATQDNQASQDNHKDDKTVAQEPKLSVGVNNHVHRQMVRSGQVIHHIGGDLIITSSVNNGAEVATDYNLHIYGKGQGRLVAGATGDENAHIFCQKFDPSLVSVAGNYCLKDDIPSEMINQAVQVSFNPEKGLVFTLIG